MKDLFDIGCNLLSNQFNSDRLEVLAAARQQGVENLVITATSVSGAKEIQGFLQAHDSTPLHPTLYTTAGIHPHDAATAEPGFEHELKRLAQHARVVALGEMGLDYNRNFSPVDRQREVFDAQIALALELDLPLFVHDRDSEGEVRERLLAAGVPPSQAVIHCFTGSKAELDAYLAAGFWIGITGWVTERKRGANLREIVSRIPLQRLLIETDAPYLKPHNVPKGSGQGRRNEPAYLCYVAEALAALYKVDPATLAAETQRNALSFFRLPARD